MSLLNRMIITGQNGIVSPRPFQDAASYGSGADAQTDELFNGYHHSHHASTLFIRAHAMRDEPALRDHYHRLAMEELDKLAEALGLELVAREDVRTR